jgi:hypothetical protein
MFLEMLREIGYDKIAKDNMEIYRVAREMTDHYMVSTRFHEKPHVFSRTGLAGMALSPLQSFATTWLGMLIEYGKLSGKGLLEGNVSKSMPLAAFAATSLLTTGMLGFVGVREWDALAHFLKEQFGVSIPSGTEYIMSNVKSDALKFGALTESLGYNVGATFGSPTLTGSFAPGLQFWWGAGKVGGNVLRGTGIAGEQNKPTQTQWRDSLKEIAPRFFPLDLIDTGLPKAGWGGIERRFTPEGLPYQEGAGKAGPILRDEDDWFARSMGTYTKKEAKEKVEYYTAARKMTKMTKHVERAVDILLAPGEINEKALEKLWMDLGSKNFTAKEIRQSVITELKSRITEADLASVRSAKTPRQQRMLLLLHQLSQGEYGRR